jgi:hypothetical protein
VKSDSAASCRRPRREKFNASNFALERTIEKLQARLKSAKKSDLWLQNAHGVLNYLCHSKERPPVMR